MSRSCCLCWSCLLKKCKILSSSNVRCGFAAVTQINPIRMMRHVCLIKTRPVLTRAYFYFVFRVCCCWCCRVHRVIYLVFFSSFYLTGTLQSSVHTQRDVTFKTSFSFLLPLPLSLTLSLVSHSFYYSLKKHKASYAVNCRQTKLHGTLLYVSCMYCMLI